MSEVIPTELRQAIQESINKYRKHHTMSGENMTDERVTDAAMAAFIDHLHDPRTIERVAKQCAHLSQRWRLWSEIDPAVQDLFRKQALTILKAVLCDD